jgi:predicted RNA-binding protein with PUA-like domain
MAYWLFKSEPDAFSWQMLKKLGAKGTQWDGVRNYQARNNMRAMTVGDLGFFYHSQSGLDVVGIVSVIAPAHPERGSDDPRWECVDVRAETAMPKPVSLAVIKDNRKLAEMALVKNSRLSVQPVSHAEWVEVCRMGGLVPAPASEE